MWSKTVSFRRRGDRRKNFSKKFFRPEKFGVQPVFFRVFAYRRGRRTGDVLPEKGQKSPKMGAPPPSVFEVRCVSIRIGLSAERRKNFFGASKKNRFTRIFPRHCETAAGPVGQNPLKFRQIRQSKLSSFAARYVGIKTVSFRRRGERRKNFSEKIFSGR